MAANDSAKEFTTFKTGNASRQPDGGVWAGVSRDLHVLGNGLVGGIGNGIVEAKDHPLLFAGELLAPAGLMLAARGPSYVRTAAMIAGVVGTGIFAEQALVGVKNSVPALSDAYLSGRNLSRDQSVVEQQLGPLAFNTLIMAGVGLGASKFGTALYGRMEFPLAGAEEPGRLPSGNLARAVDRARPAIVRIAGETMVSGEARAFQGSGFIFNRDGYVLTSLHNVDPALTKGFDVILSNGERRGWQLVGQDPVNDLAVLRLAKTSASERFATLSVDANTLKQGANTVGVGYEGRSDVLAAAPAKFAGTQSIDEGFAVRYSDNRPLVPGSTRNVFVGAFDSGQSGGPVLNVRGRVVGLMTNRVDLAPGQENTVLGMAARARYMNALLKQINL